MPLCRGFDRRLPSIVQYVGSSVAADASKAWIPVVATLMDTGMDSPEAYTAVTEYSWFPESAGTLHEVVETFLYSKRFL